MRKVIIWALLSSLLLSGCSSKAWQARDITCEEVVEAYENAGYTVSHQHPADNGDWVCYVTVEDEQTDQRIWFHWFETVEEAEDHADQRQYNVLLWFMSLLYGDPSWLHTGSYHNIEVEHEGGDIVEPFVDLMR